MAAAAPPRGAASRGSTRRRAERAAALLLAQPLHRCRESSSSRSSSSVPCSEETRGGSIPRHAERIQRNTAAPLVCAPAADCLQLGIRPENPLHGGRCGEYTKAQPRGRFCFLGRVREAKQKARAIMQASELCGFLAFAAALCVSAPPRRVRRTSAATSRVQTFRAALSPASVTCGGGRATDRVVQSHGSTRAAVRWEMLQRCELCPTAAQAAPTHIAPAEVQQPPPGVTEDEQRLVLRREARGHTNCQPFGSAVVPPLSSLALCCSLPRRCRDPPAEDCDRCVVLPLCVSRAHHTESSSEAESRSNSASRRRSTPHSAAFAAGGRTLR